MRKYERIEISHHCQQTGYATRLLYTYFLPLLHTGVYYAQPLMSDSISQRRLFFFGYLCRACTSQDHSQALQACIRGTPTHNRGKPG